MRHCLHQRCHVLIPLVTSMVVMRLVNADGKRCQVTATWVSTLNALALFAFGLPSNYIQAGQGNVGDCSRLYMPYLIAERGYGYNLGAVMLRRFRVVSPAMALMALLSIAWYMLIVRDINSVR